MYKITIDPGHGGRDRANKGPTGYIEADGTLKISLLLEAELLKTNAFSVQLTRREDKYLTLTERGKMAVLNKSHLFISQHTNAFNTRVSGTGVYYSVDLPQDRQLAERLSSAVALALGIPDRGAKTRPSLKNPNEDYYTVIDTAQDGGVPHVILVESAFHDHAGDEKLLKDETMLRKIAKAQAKVICEWFGVAIVIDTGNDDTVGNNTGGNNTGDSNTGSSSADESNTNTGNTDINSLPVLKRKSIGDAVKLLQSLLNNAGFDSGITDGKFGLKTLGAVKTFQSAKGLAVDGIVGPKTWKALLSSSDAAKQ